MRLHSVIILTILLICVLGIINHTIQYQRETEHFASSTESSISEILGWTLVGIVCACIVVGIFVKIGRIYEAITKAEDETVQTPIKPAPVLIKPVPVTPAPKVGTVVDVAVESIMPPLSGDKSRYLKYMDGNEKYIATKDRWKTYQLSGEKEKYWKQAYIIHPTDFKLILQRFIKIKQNENMEFYNGYTPDMLLTRFIHDRSLVFYNANDTHVTRPAGFTGTDYKDFKGQNTELQGFSSNRIHALLDDMAAMNAICNDAKYKLIFGDDAYEHICKVISLKNTLPYDEMLLSALIGLSAYTRFINDGARDNNGNTGAAGSYEEDGIFMGLVGARLEVQGIMDYTTLYADTPSQHIKISDTAKCVREYIKSIDIGAEYLVILQELFDKKNRNFYKRMKTMYYTSPKSTINVIVPSLLTTIRNNEDKIDGLIEYTGIDPLLFVKRLTIPAKLLLDDAVRRMKYTEFKNRKAYVVANGLGDGAWKPIAFGTDVVCFLNVCAWLSLVFKPEYDTIPIIEYRRWFDTQVYPDTVQEHIIDIIKKLPGYNTRIKQVVPIKQDNSTETFNGLVYSITINDNATRYFIYRHSVFNFAKSVSSLCELKDGTGDYYKKAYKPNETNDTNEKTNALLVSMFAWDSNSYVGNEFWVGAWTASGDPAAACCSDITITMNPERNTEYLTAKYANGVLCLRSELFNTKQNSTDTEYDKAFTIHLEKVNKKVAKDHDKNLIKFLEGDRNAKLAQLADAETIDHNTIAIELIKNNENIKVENQKPVEPTITNTDDNAEQHKVDNEEVNKVETQKPAEIQQAIVSNQILEQHKAEIIQLKQKLEEANQKASDEIKKKEIFDQYNTDLRRVQQKMADEKQKQEQKLLEQKQERLLNHNKLKKQGEPENDNAGRKDT